MLTFHVYGKEVRHRKLQSIISSIKVPRGKEK